MKALTKTDFNFPGQKSVYPGKVMWFYLKVSLTKAKC